MRKLIKLAIVIIILLLSTSILQASEWLNYTNLKTLIDKYGLSRERDTLTNRVIFSGNGIRIVTSPRMFTILINGQLVILSNYVKTINGEIFIPAIDLPKIEDYLKAKKTPQVQVYDNTAWRLKKVVIDPGHGGIFKGAQSKDNNILEKDITLDIALRLRDLLIQKGIEVVMTRTKDVSLSNNLNEDLNRRVAIANREQPDLFISIHADWSNRSSVYGFTIYYCSEKLISQNRLKCEWIGQLDELDNNTRWMLASALRDEYLKETLDFAREIQKAFQILPTRDLGVREEDFRVIKYTECPSVLVEVDFLSNPDACKRLSNPSYRQQIAERLATAILNYQNLLLITERFTK